MNQNTSDLKNISAVPGRAGPKLSSYGRQENIRGVLTIFVNGKMLSQQSLRGFQQAIEAELKKRNRK